MDKRGLVKSVVLGVVLGLGLALLVYLKVRYW